MTHRMAHIAACCGLALGIVVASSANAQGQSALPGATYDSIKSLPDWSGWWGLEGPVSAEIQRIPLPLKPQLAAAMNQGTTSDTGGFRDLYCRPSEFTGYSGGFTESVEFLFTPGRVTLTSESGLVRRIYTDGLALPKETDPTSTGTFDRSLGRSDAGGRDDGHRSESAVPAALRGRDSHRQERSYRGTRVDANREPLRVEITTTAPDILSG